jgi:hypothetical protein
MHKPFLVERELRVVNHPKPPKKQKKQKKAKKKCFGDYLDLGRFRLVWKTFFLFLWEFLRINPD